MTIDIFCELAESYMREPMCGEQPCVMGNECECMFIDPNNPFIAVEFKVPNDEEVENTPQMCVICSRAATQQLFYDIVFDHVTFNGVIQRFGNLHSIPNEYNKVCVLDDEMRR